MLFDYIICYCVVVMLYIVLYCCIVVLYIVLYCFIVLLYMCYCYYIFLDYHYHYYYYHTVSFHNFKSQNFKLSVSNPKNKCAAYVSVPSQISNCQSLGRKNKHEILKTDRRHMCLTCMMYYCLNVYSIVHIYIYIYIYIRVYTISYN